MEIFIATIVLVVCTIFVMFFNNKELIQHEKGFIGKCKVLFYPRKNTIICGLTTFLLGEILFFITYFHYVHTLEYSLKLLCVFALLVPVAYIDYKKHIIPNQLIIVGLILFILFAFYELVIVRYDTIALLKMYGFGLLLGGGVFTLCAILAKGSMGMGDIKLYSVLGLLLGWEGVFNVIFFSVLGVAVFGIIMILSKKKNGKSLVPIGPFSLFGIVISILFGL